MVDSKHISARSCFDLSTKPSDTNEFYVASSSGDIVCCRRFGELPSPCNFSPTALPDACLCLKFSPFMSNILVAGYESGSVNLFSLDSTEPILIWNSVSEHNIINIEWSSHRPSVFIALDSAGTLLAFDLLNDEQRPTQIASLGYSIPSMSLSARGKDERNSQSILAVPDKDSSSVQAILLNDTLSLAKTNELTQFQGLMNSVC